MTLPECRKALTKITLRLPDPLKAEVLDIVEQMKRRPAVRKTSAKSQPITPELRENILRYAARNPNASQGEMGAVFGVNSGRVSEAMAGFRA